MLNTCMIPFVGECKHTEFDWCREWERIALASGMWLCFFSEYLPRCSYTLNDESRSSIL